MKTAKGSTSSASTVHFDGPCPFLTCLKDNPHDHPICEECGAVRYGNPFYCATCKGHRDRLAEADAVGMMACSQCGDELDCACGVCWTCHASS